MRKLLYSFLILSIIFLSSCSNAVEESGVGYVRLTAVAEKALDVIDSGRIEKYEYTAEPLFSTKETLYGTTDDWTKVEANEQSSALIGPFTQGKWKFGLRAVSSKSYVLWQGESEYYIGASTQSVVPITMARVDGAGMIDFRLDIPEYTEDLASPVVTIDGVTQNPKWEIEGKGTGNVQFHAVIENVSVGWHSITVRAGDGGSMVGEAIAVEVSNGNYTFVRGSFDVGEYVEAYLKLDAPEAARSEIRNSSGTAITSDEMKKNETRTYTYALTNGRTAAEVNWYVNGEQKSSGTNYTFVPDATGVFELSALSRYYAESELGGEWIEESTSSSITVYVEPQLSTITWNTGEYVTRQYLAYDTVLTIGAPSREGYEFKSWAVTGSMTGSLSQGDTLTVSGSAYTMTAVWEEKPKLKLKCTASDTNKYTISLDSASSSQVKATEELGVVFTTTTPDMSKVSLRWYLDSEEIFWVVDKGNGTYSIPTAAEAGITAGTHKVNVKAVSGSTSYSGTFNLTWK